MMTCPRCKKSRVRVKVNLFLDIPTRLAHRLSKRNLRDRAVRVEGAGWPTMVWYCECGWMLREGREKKARK